MNSAAPTTIAFAELTLTLADLKPGEKATITAIGEHYASSRRLLALGFVPGSEITVRRIAPMRDPIEFCVRGACISIRRAEAAWIQVRPAAP